MFVSLTRVAGTRIIGSVKNPLLQRCWWKVEQQDTRRTPVRARVWGVDQLLRVGDQIATDGQAAQVDDSRLSKRRVRFGISLVVAVL